MPNLHQCSLLVVDDNADTRLLFTTVLETAGADVTAVSSAREALAVLPQINPDALICDLVMPEFDGCMFINQLRLSDQFRWKRLPAIAVTALALEQIQTRAIAAGFHSVLTKPLDPEELIFAVAGLIQQVCHLPFTT